MQTFEPLSSRRSLKNKKLIVIFVTSIFFAFIVGYSIKNFMPVADVGGSLISRGEFVSLLTEQSGKVVMQKIIVKKFILEEAKKQKITVSNDEIKKQVDLIKNQLVKEKSTFKQYLSMQGVNEKQFHEEIMLQLMVKKLFGTSIVVSDKEIDAYLKANKIIKGKGAIYQSQKVDVTDDIFKLKLQEKFKMFISQKLVDTKIQYFIKL